MRRIGLDLAAQPGDAEINGAVEGLHLAMRGRTPAASRVATAGWGFRRTALRRSNSLAVSVSSLPSAGSASTRFSRSRTRRPIRTRGPDVAGAPVERRSTLLIRASSSRGSIGLADVVVGAGFEPDHAVHRVGGGGDHDDADPAALLAQPTRQREAVLARQTDVEQHQRRQFAFEQPPQRDAAFGAANPEMLLVEVVDTAAGAASPRPRPRRYADGDPCPPTTCRLQTRLRSYFNASMPARAI